MKEKKQFFIPKNYAKKFEWIPGISGIQHIFFVPAAFVSYLVWMYTSFEAAHKVVAILVIIGLPYMLIATKPIRPNVSLYKHMYWKFRFGMRQKKFLYKKEGYMDVIQTSSKDETHDIGKTSESKPRKRKIHTRLNSVKGSRKRAVDYSGQQSSAVSKGVGN